MELYLGIAHGPLRTCSVACSVHMPRSTFIVLLPSNQQHWAWRNAMLIGRIYWTELIVLLIQLYHVPAYGQNKCISALHLPFLSFLVGECSFSFLSKKHFICCFVFCYFVCLWFSNITMSHTTLTYGYNFLECFAINNLCRTFLWVVLWLFLKEFHIWNNFPYWYTDSF